MIDLLYVLAEHGSRHVDDLPSRLAPAVAAGLAVGSTRIEPTSAGLCVIGY